MDFYHEWPRSEDGRWVSEERYWTEYYNHPDFNYEWNNGYLEEKGPSRQVTVWLYHWFCFLISRFLKTNDLGQTTGLGMGFRFTLPTGEVQVRKPDLGVVLKSNPVSLEGHEYSYRGIFDLCVEAISDSDRTQVARDAIHKKKEYAQAGTKEYYLLDGWGSNTAFYHVNSQGVYEPLKPDANGIIRSTLLPGFQFRVSDLKRCPDLEELVKDEVYAYVMPAFFKILKRRSSRESDYAPRMGKGT